MDFDSAEHDGPLRFEGRRLLLCVDGKKNTIFLVPSVAGLQVPRRGVGFLSEVKVVSHGQRRLFRAILLCGIAVCLGLGCREADESDEGEAHEAT